MFSNQFNQSITINVKSSLIKQLLIWFPHAISTTILILFLKLQHLNITYFLLLIICIVISLVYFIRLHLLFSANKSIHTIQKSTNDIWKVTFKNGVEKNVSLMNTSFVSSLFIILNFNDSTSKQYSALISSDSVNHDEFRRLKVFIKSHRLNS